MKTHPNNSIKPLMLVATLWLLSIGSLAHAATITWTNTSGGNWSVAANWSPNQVPANTDTALITTPGTYTVTLDSYVTMANLTLGAGVGANGVQTLTVTSLSLTATNSLLVTGGGVLNASGDNAVLSGATTVANGGVLNLAAGYSNCSFGFNPLIVTNGGMVNAGGQPLIGFGYSYGSTFYGVATIAKGGVFTANGAWPANTFNVASGGVLNIITNGLYLVSPLVNAGTINMSNTLINIYNVPNAEYGGLVNLAGGTIKVAGSTSLGLNGGGYIINQGSLVQTAGPGCNMNVGNFDNTVGTVTNLAGTLTMGTYQTNLAGIYYAAAGATNQFVGANNPTPVTPGTPFVLAGSGQHQFIAGFLSLTDQTYSNLTLIADSLVLGPAFQGGVITNLALDGIGFSNTLPVAGIFTATNSKINGNFTIANGGVFIESNSTTYGNVMVAGGGVINASGGVIFDSLYNTYVGGWNVAPGGVVNLSGTVKVWSSITNGGKVNISSNTAVSLTANPQGGIVNLAGGVLDFLGGGSSIYYNAGPEYFINRGALVQNSPGGTNTITILGFDTSLGTVTNLAGTLLLGQFQTNLAGTYSASAGATIQLIGGTAAAPVSPGTPLVLGGGGSYQFVSDQMSFGTHGYLYLPNNDIPNLTMQGGQLELGPNFQGGAITNLTLSGIELTNPLATTLPITGTFTVLNSGGVLYNYGAQLIYTGVYGNYTVMNGGLLTVSNSDFHGAVTVANGGVLNAQGGNMYGAVMVANGGLITLTTAVFGAGLLINPSGSLTLAAGSTLDITGSSLDLLGPLNNAGTINITNAAPAYESGVYGYNDGSGNYLGGITNQASGLVNLGSDSTYFSPDNGGYGYIVNQGRIIKSAGTNISDVDAPFMTNSGAITVQSGSIFMNPLILQPGGSLNVGLNSATNYGSFIIYPGYGVTETQALASAFNVTLNNGYVPANGTTFNVLSYGAYTGSFSSLGLPSAVSWQSSYGSTNFTLMVGSPKPQFGTFNLAGTNLIFTGLGGSPGSNYVVLASTNLTLPLANWSALTTNQFDGSGHFHYTNHVSPAKPRQFFIFKLP